MTYRLPFPTRQSKRLPDVLPFNLGDKDGAGTRLNILGSCGEQMWNGFAVVPHRSHDSPWYARSVVLVTHTSLDVHVCWQTRHLNLPIRRERGGGVNIICRGRIRRIADNPRRNIYSISLLMYFFFFFRVSMIQNITIPKNVIRCHSTTLVTTIKWMKWGKKIQIKAPLEHNISTRYQRNNGNTLLNLWIWE